MQFWSVLCREAQTRLGSPNDTMQAPIVALYVDLSTPMPIYVSGTLFVTARFIALLLPFEPRGRAFHVREVLIDC